MSQKDTGFHRRLAYVRWLRARGRAAPESDRELADATGVGYPWLNKWKGRKDAPDSHEMRIAFANGLKVDGAWLFDNKGTPPEPELWSYWNVEVGGEDPRGGAAARPRTKPKRR